MKYKDMTKEQQEAYRGRYPKFCVSGVITAEASSPQTE
jgi:hypothetical protein